MHVSTRKWPALPCGVLAALGALALPPSSYAREPGEPRDERRLAPRVFRPVPSPAAPSAGLDGPDSSPWLPRSLQTRYILESGPVSFGPLEPGVDREIPAAIRVRVFSPNHWTLSVVPTTPLRVVEGGESVPLSRLAWRSPLSGGFVPARDGGSLTIARGSPTGGGGFLVVVDARLTLSSTDPTGHYACNFRLLLEDP